MDQLASLIADFPEIAQNSHFIFIPGPQDPWSGNILPHSKLSTSYTAKLESKLKNVHFSSNPCRSYIFIQNQVLYSGNCCFSTGFDGYNEAEFHSSC
jgi:DNA polymerase epsilon subunit 2